MIRIDELPPRPEALGPEQTRKIFGGCTAAGDYCLENCDCCDEWCSLVGICVNL